MDPDKDESEDVEIISTHDEKVKTVGEILSNDSSREILNLLNSGNEMTINEIAQKTGLSLSLVTHHIKKMQSVEVVKISKVGRSVKGHKMNYYSATNQSFLIVPSKEPIHSVTSSLKKFSKFFAIGMAGIVSWMTLRPQNDGRFQDVDLSQDSTDIHDENQDEWDSGEEIPVEGFDNDANKNSRADEDKSIVDSFTSGEENEEKSSELVVDTVSSEPMPEPEPEPSHSGIVEFDFSEESITLDDAVRQNTGSASLDSEVYPVPYSSEVSYASDIDGLFLSIIIPVIIVVAGIVLERVLTRWYNKRKIKN